MQKFILTLTMFLLPFAALAQTEIPELADDSEIVDESENEAILVGTDRHKVVQIKESLKFHVSGLDLDDVPQGIWKLSDERYLVTQDPDSSGEQNGMRFNILNGKGQAIRAFDKGYGGHGQSLYVRTRSDGDYDVFTEAENRNGLARFKLSKDLTQLKFIGEIKVVTASGDSLRVSAFGVEADQNTLVLAYNSKGETKTVRKFDLAEFLKGRAVPLSPKIRFSVDNGKWLQGVGITGGVAYVLVGDMDPDHRKLIIRVPFDGSKVERFQFDYGQAGAEKKYEPEGIWVQNGRILFGIRTADSCIFGITCNRGYSVLKMPAF